MPRAIFSAALLNAIRTNIWQDTELDLSGQQLGLEGTLTLAEALKNNTYISSLNVSNNQIDDVGARALLANTTLTSLNVRNNYIGNTGAWGLATNTTLTSLDVEGNYIGLDLIYVLALLLDQNKKWAVFRLAGKAEERKREKGTEEVKRAAKEGENRFKPEVSSSASSNSSSSFSFFFPASNVASSVSYSPLDTSSMASLSVLPLAVLVPSVSIEDLQKMYADLKERLGILEGLIEGGESGYIPEHQEVDRQREEVFKRLSSMGLAPAPSIRLTFP